jgi:predicted nucleic acid-binding protein
VDTNIIIDLITLRAPFGIQAVKLFDKVKTDHWMYFTSAISISNTHYIISKELGTSRSKDIIASLLNVLEIIPADRLSLIGALSSKITDYEDAIQLQCAIKILGIDGIITRDLKDFKESTIPVYSPEQVLY